MALTLYNSAMQAASSKHLVVYNLLLVISNVLWFSSPALARRLLAFAPFLLLHFHTTSQRFNNKKKCKTCKYSSQQPQRETQALVAEAKSARERRVKWAESKPVSHFIALLDRRSFCLSLTRSSETRPQHTDGMGWRENKRVTYCYSHWVEWWGQHGATTALCTRVSEHHRIHTHEIKSSALRFPNWKSKIKIIGVSHISYMLYSRTACPQAKTSARDS